MFLHFILLRSIFTKTCFIIAEIYFSYCISVENLVAALGFPHHATREGKRTKFSFVRETVFWQIAGGARGDFRRNRRIFSPSFAASL